MALSLSLDEAVIQAPANDAAEEGMNFPAIFAVSRLKISAATRTTTWVPTSTPSDTATIFIEFIERKRIAPGLVVDHRHRDAELLRDGVGHVRRDAQHHRGWAPIPDATPVVAASAAQ
ncbi:hypothetical protein GCM10020254_10990 [Streptomyces goshikiensis]